MDEGAPWFSSVEVAKNQVCFMNFVLEYTQKKFVLKYTGISCNKMSGYPIFTFPKPTNYEGLVFIKYWFIIKLFEGWNGFIL